MISAEFAEMQIARLDATSNFHMKSATAIAELVKALGSNATSEQEAEEAVSLWLAHERECMTPADVRGSLQEIREGKPDWRKPAPKLDHCRTCHGSGYVMVEQIYGVPGEERITMAAKRCRCGQ